MKKKRTIDCGPDPRPKPPDSQPPAWLREAERVSEMSDEEFGRYQEEHGGDVRDEGEA